ncbi:MAG: site-2 protease family protein [Coriobacteriia bacterium]
MFDIPSIRLGKIFGIPLEINLSWAFIFVLLAFSLGTAYFPALSAAENAPVWMFAVLGVLTSVLFFASIIAHELAHSLVSLKQGGHVDKITLFIFGGVSQITEEPATPGKEFVMAVVGPLTSIVLAALCFGGYTLAISQQAAWWIWAPLQYLAAINFFVGIFNLLPGFPLDGGRVLRSLIWGATRDPMKATRWAARSGQAIGWAMVTLAVVLVLAGQGNYIWFGIMGWFIAWLAGASYREQQLRARIGGVTVGKVMSQNPEYVSGDISVESLVQEHLLGRGHSRYPVLHDGAIIGIVGPLDVKALSRNLWPQTRVVDITNRDLANLSVSSDTPVLSVLPRLAGERPGALLVVSEGRLAGIVTRSDVLRLVERVSV